VFLPIYFQAAVDYLCIGAKNARPERVSKSATMEVYYKDLISKEATLEKLVDDLMLVVQGAEEFAEANGAHLEQASQAELRSRLEELKLRCRRLRHHAVEGVQAADKLMRRHPYSTISVAFGIGLLTAWCLRRKR